MLSQDRFLYAMNGRVLWIGTRLTQVPVLTDLYTAHLFKGQVDSEVPITDYVIEGTHQLVVNGVKYTPIEDSQIKQTLLLNSKKLELFLHLCEVIEVSHRLSLPQVFFEESDNVEIMTKSMVGKELGVDAQDKHQIFIRECFEEKKKELKARYLEGVQKIKVAADLSDLAHVARGLSLAQIHV
jgi:hypothetical protein